MALTGRSGTFGSSYFSQPVPVSSVRQMSDARFTPKGCCQEKSGTKSVQKFPGREFSGRYSAGFYEIPFENCQIQIPQIFSTTMIF